MPWQQMVADVATEYDPVTLLPAYREVIVSVPRQSGKTTEELVVTLDCGLMRGAPKRMAYTAQTGQDARAKVINDWYPTLKRSPFKPAITRMLRGAAETAMDFRTGSRLEVLATAEEAGHGRVLDLGFIDEAFADEDDRREQALLPAMATRADAQLWVLSTMGTGNSNYLNRKVTAGRIAAETERNPEIGRAFLDAGPRRMKAAPLLCRTCSTTSRRPEARLGWPIQRAWMPMVSMRPPVSSASSSI